MRRCIPKCINLGRLAILALALASTSCLGIDSNITIRNDGSGELKLVYRVSKMVASLDALGKEQQILPFPLTRSAFIDSLNTNPGLELRSYSQTEDQDDIITETDIAFASLPPLVAFLNAQGARTDYSEAEGVKTFSLRLFLGSASRAAPLDAEILKLGDAAFAPYAIKLKVSLPSPATKSGIASVAKSGLELSFADSPSEIAKKNDSTLWEFSWR